MCTSSANYKEVKFRFIPITKGSGIKVKNWTTGEYMDLSELSHSTDELNINKNVKEFNFEKRTLPDGTITWHKI